MKTFKNYLEIIQEQENEQEQKQESENKDELLIKKLTIINRTPHDITVNGITYPKTDKVTRVDPIEKPTDNKFFVNQSYGEIKDIDPQEEGHLYIVSSIVLSAISNDNKYKHRKDFIAPNTGKNVIRDQKGQIIGVSNFICKWGKISEIM